MLGLDLSISSVIYLPIWDRIFPPVLVEAFTFLYGHSHLLSHSLNIFLFLF